MTGEERRAGLKEPAPKPIASEMRRELRIGTVVQKHLVFLGRCLQSRWSSGGRSLCGDVNSTS